MDLYSASVYELRGELRRLQRELLPTPISAMKRCDVIRHIEAFNKALEQLTALPVVEGGSGKLPPRPIRSITENTAGEIIYSIPLFPAPRAFGPENKTSQE
jgi:hypothetical protein